MKIKTALYSLLLLNILALTTQDVHSENSGKGEWTQIIIEDFNITEQFFLHSGCRFSYPSVHVYDWINAKWLSPEEAKKLVPALEGKFSIISYSATHKSDNERFESCPMKVTRERMSAYIGKGFKIDGQYLLLLFEPPFSPKSGRSVLENSNEAFIQRAIQLLEKKRNFADLVPIRVKISIKTSLKGLKGPTN